MSGDNKKQVWLGTELHDIFMKINVKKHNN